MSALATKRIKAPRPKTGEIPGHLRSVGGLRRIELEEYEPGVYFLCHVGEVVYVGQSTSPKLRISTHISEGTKVFDHAFIRHCREDELNELESFFIHSLEPLHNCKMRNGQMLAPKTMSDITSTARHLLRKSAPERSRDQPQPPARTSTQCPDRLLRLPEVMNVTGLRRSAIYTAMNEGRFPRPKKFGRACLWPADEIKGWIEQIVDRRSAA